MFIVRYLAFCRDADPFKDVYCLLLARLDRYQCLLDLQMVLCLACWPKMVQGCKVKGSRGVVLYGQTVKNHFERRSSGQVVKLTVKIF